MKQGFRLGLMVALWATVARGSPQDATLSVRPFAGVPPATISDLSASSTTLSGQIRVTWTAPPVYPGSTLDSYQILVQTFSVASVGGSNNTWWNTSGGLLIQGLYGESPGMSVVRTLGPPGSSHDTTFNLGMTYYVGVRSADDMGVPRNFWSGIQVDPAYLPPAITPSPPKKPTAVWGETLSNGNLQLSWREVTRDIDNLPITPDHYVIERFSAINSTPTLVSTVPPGTLTYTTTPNGIYYYRVRAVGLSGEASEGTEYVDSSPQNYLYILASDDASSRLVVSGEGARILRKENNSYGDDIQIVLSRRNDQENQVTIRAYSYEARRASSGQTIPGFVFEQPANIQVGYGTGGNNVLLGAPSELENPFADAEAVAKIAAIYWFNGNSYVRLGGTVITSQQAFRIQSRTLGLYAIRAIASPTKFGLSRGSPYPRVITPNGSENRRVFFFVDNPTDGDLIGQIYDVRGAKVRSLRVDGMSPTATTLVWDGRDEQGAVVPSGVYLYEIGAGKEKVTGTVAVAR